MAAFASKITAVGFGFLIPFFFVSSGIDFNLDALGEPAALAKLFLFLALFLVVRGLPAMVLYTRDLARRDRIALAFFSATELPLVVAITTLAEKAGDMRASTASALVGAAIISTLIFPLLGLRIRRDRPPEPGEPPEPLAAEA
jgi:Kef-type K+ transport system membrane component KefB